jgi:hypothetical protein
MPLKVLWQNQSSRDGGLLVEDGVMPSDKSQYRGYEIRLRQEWSNWCAHIHPTRDDLPMLALSPLRTLSQSRKEALAAAKHNIDEALGDVKQDVA